MFDSRLRTLDAGPNSLRGFVERFPKIPTPSPSIEPAATDVADTLTDHLERRMGREATRKEFHEFPPTRAV